MVAPTHPAPSYLEDASGYRGEADELYLPENETELREIVLSAVRSGIPVTLSGAGTGVTGARVPHGGWVISLERFRRLEILDGEAIAGVGIILRDLQAAAARTGQFYAPDPTEISASIGGTIATNASGSRSFLYGDTRRHVLAMRVMLMDGTVRELRRGQPIDIPFTEVPGPNTTKHSAGYWLRKGMDALDLFIGSEGTLGIVTEAHLRLLPSSEQLLSGVVFFDSDAHALSAVERWRSVQGLRMLEYMDRGSLEILLSRYPEVPAAAHAALLIEQENASDECIDEWLARIEDCGALGEQSWFGIDDHSRERFRRFRHALPEQVNEIVRRRGLLKMATDFAVPLHRNRDMMAAYKEHLERSFPGSYCIFGHIGDAHVHVNILPANSDEQGRAREVIVEMARTAVSLGGTVSAEHGLGKRKAFLLNVQYSPRDIESMLEVKRRLDPSNLLGRETLFPLSTQ